MSSDFKPIGHSQTFYINAKWDTAHRAAVQAQAANGYRYTQDFRDGPRGAKNLHATTRFATTLLNPVYDRDDDNGDRRWEEAEITSNSSQFPSVNENYYADVQFSHWYASCSGGCYVWDPDGGEVGFSSQISEWSGLLGEWNTVDPSSTYRYIPYPVQNQPAGTALPTGAKPAADVSPGSPTRFTAELDGLRLTGEDDGQELDLRVAAPDAPEAYVAENEDRANAVFELRGPHRVVVTFERPISVEVFRDMVQAAGVRVASIEAIGLTTKKQILTVGGEPGILEHLEGEFEMLGARLEGIVAADAVLDDRGAFESLSDQGGVLLVDVAPALVIQRIGATRPDLVRAFGDRFDVIVNDLYWVTGELPE